MTEQFLELSEGLRAERRGTGDKQTHTIDTQRHSCGSPPSRFSNQAGVHCWHSEEHRRLTVRQGIEHIRCIEATPQIDGAYRV